MAELHEQVANYWWTWYWQFQWHWFWSILAWLSSSPELTIVLVRIIGVCEHWSGRSSSTKALEGWFVNMTTIIRLSAISPLLVCMCFVFLSWSLQSALIPTKCLLKVEHLQTSLFRATTTTSFPPPSSSLANSHPNPTKVDHFNTHLCVCNGEELLRSAKTIADTIAANRRSHGHGDSYNNDKI